MLGIPAQQAVVGCNLLHHFILKKCLFLLFISFVLDIYFFSSFTVVGCNLLHHFIFGKNVCFCYLFRLFWICTSFSLYFGRI